MNRSDVVLDHSRYFSGDLWQRSSLTLAFHRMVTADYLVMSRSALSMAAALLTNATVLFPACWREFRRPLPNWRMWDCCTDPSEVPKGGNCQSEGARRKWPQYRVAGWMHQG